jgi:hypothetical protein
MFSEYKANLLATIKPPILCVDAILYKETRQALQLFSISVIISAATARKMAKDPRAAIFIIAFFGAFFKQKSRTSLNPQIRGK